jgi:hypothetical protein
MIPEAPSLLAWITTVPLETAVTRPLTVVEAIPALLIV